MDFGLFFLLMALPGLETAAAVRSMRMFAAHVAPAVQAATMTRGG